MKQNDPEIRHVRNGYIFALRFIGKKKPAEWGLKWITMSI